ncbi:MAG: hypothetical protein QM723_10115 [Myxococcaceae bacterium]
MLLLCISLLLGAGDDVGEARKHFEAGRALYSVNRFADAQSEFEAGYALAPRPLFLFNIAQAARRVAETTGSRPTMLKAQARYREYLEHAKTADPERDESLKQLTAIDAWLAAHPAEAERPADAPTAEPVAVAPVSEPAPVAATSPAVTQPAAEQPGFFSQHPWVIAVAAAVVVAGAGVGTYFGVRAANGGCPTASIGCLDARPR